MLKREWSVFIEDMLESINKIEQYVNSMNFDEFNNDSKTVDAVIRNFEILGEAARHIPHSIRTHYSLIPWRDIIDFRNRITHEYFTISLQIVWEIIQKELPKLKLQLEELLSSQK